MPYKASRSGKSSSKGGAGKIKPDTKIRPAAPKIKPTIHKGSSRKRGGY